jgi:hypothetical protein
VLYDKAFGLVGNLTGSLEDLIRDSRLLQEKHGEDSRVFFLSQVALCENYKALRKALRLLRAHLDAQPSLREANRGALQKSADRLWAVFSHVHRDREKRAALVVEHYGLDPEAKKEKPK